MKRIQVNGIIVHEEVLTTKFACAYQVCKGACCYVEDAEVPYEGCDVTEDEATLIEQNRGVLEGIVQRDSQELPKALTYSNENGVFVTCDPKGRCCLDCSNGCALRIAQREGLLSYGNPIACHLYPLVVTKQSRTHLRVGHYYDRYHLCDSAYVKGEKEGIWLIDFCKEAIIRKFGEDFFNKLQERAKHYRAATLQEGV